MAEAKQRPRTSASKPHRKSSAVQSLVKDRARSTAGSSLKKTHVERLSRVILENAKDMPATSFVFMEHVIRAIASGRSVDELAQALSKTVANDPAVQPKRARFQSFEGEGAGKYLSAEGLADRLVTVSAEESTEWAQTELLGATAAATRLGVRRSTLDNWRRDGRVLAFSRGVRNFVFPMDQFQRTKPLDGLADIRAHFGSDEETWEWLITSNRLTRGQAPIESLRKGEVAEGVRAAEGALDYG